MKQFMCVINPTISCQNCIYWQGLTVEELKESSINPEWYHKNAWGYCHYDSFGCNLRDASFCSKFRNPRGDTL